MLRAAFGSMSLPLIWLWRRRLCHLPLIFPSPPIRSYSERLAYLAMYAPLGERMPASKKPPSSALNARLLRRRANRKTAMTMPCCRLLQSRLYLMMAAGRGLFRELISIAALTLAALVGLFLYGRFRFEARELISPNWLADGALGLGSFAIVYMILVFMFSGVVKNLRGKDVGFLDRLLGAGFGVARGLLVCSLAVMVFTASYREAKAAQEFRNEINNGGTEITEEMLEKAPQSIRVKTLAKSQMKSTSSNEPLLHNIGSQIKQSPPCHWTRSAV